MNLRYMLRPFWIKKIRRSDERVDTQWCTFRIRAIVIHIGNQPDSGHYRTLVPLLGEGEPSHTHVCVADDNRSPERMAIELRPQLLEQAYLFFLSVA